MSLRRWRAIAALLCAAAFGCDSILGLGDYGGQPGGGETTGGNGGSSAAGGAGGQTAGGGGAAGHGASGGYGASGAYGGQGGELPCNAGFAFNPTTIVAAVPFEVSFTHIMGLTDVYMYVTGPGPPNVSSGPYGDGGAGSIWSYFVSSHGAGELLVEFYWNGEKGMGGILVADCRKWSNSP